MGGQVPEPVVTTTMFTGPEKAAWQVAVSRGLGVGAADVRALLEAAAPLIRADERANLRALLPYHTACCERFTLAVADLLSDHEDSP